MPGPERALLYRVAAETGVRWSELRSLRRSSFNLESKPATVTVEAGYTKNRRKDILPLRAETATAMHGFFAAAPSANDLQAFPHMPRGTVGGKMIEEDLTAAGVKSDCGGVVVDFHALRHSFISSLADGGVHPKTAQDLARHSTIALTMDNYTHTVLESRSKALAALPNLDEPPAEEAVRATGTEEDSVYGSCSAKQAHPDPIKADQSGLAERAKSQTRDMQKDPANTGENPHSQGPSAWSGRAPMSGGYNRR